MSHPTQTTAPPHEVERRLREYRQRGFEQRALPHIFFRPPFVVCPWPECDHHIAGIDFPLEFLSDRTKYEQLLAAWWQGAGLVGRCPGCRNFVLFTMHGKECVDDPGPHGLAVLPDDWQEKAFFLKESSVVRGP